MVPRRNAPSCVICGVPVEDELFTEFPWMKKFYAGKDLDHPVSARSSKSWVLVQAAKLTRLLSYLVYVATGNATSTVYLSGDGRRGQFTDVITADSEASTDGGHGTEMLEINLTPRSFGGSAVLATRPDASPVACGFPFHSACWDLMMMLCPRDQMNTQVLFELCLSFPSKGGGVLDWGHDYYGATRYPEQMIQITPGEESGIAIPVSSALYCSDPLDITELQRLFMPGHSGYTMDSVEALHCSVPWRGARDPFSTLPPEILGAILEHLPTSAIGPLKLASGVFANVALSDSFWRSRFLPGREFDYILESGWHPSSHRGYWRWLYFSVRSLHDHPSVANRRRIWTLASSLLDLLRTAQDTSCKGDPARSFLEPAAAVDEKQWVTASMALRPPINFFSFVSRSLYERIVTLPRDGAAIYASTTTIHGRQYITGIRIGRERGSSVVLGYRHPQRETLCLSDLKRSGMAGFCLAQDRRGVRGLAAISATGDSSAWIGDHHGIPQRRLVLDSLDHSPVNLLKGGFDVSDLLASHPHLRSTKF